jgi:hypothetical protein
MLQGSGANAAMWLPDVETYERLRLYAVDAIGEPGAGNRQTAGEAISAAKAFNTPGTSR